MQKKRDRESFRFESIDLCLLIIFTISLSYCMQFSFLLHTLSILYILLYSCKSLKVSSSILVYPKFFFYSYYFIFPSNCTYVFLSIFPITFSYSSFLSFIVHLVALFTTFSLHRTHRWVSFIKPKAMQKQQLSKASSSSGVAQSSIKKSNSNSIYICTAF